MGYFKKRRQAAETKRLDTMLSLFAMQTEGTYGAVKDGVLEAIKIFDSKKYEFEGNARYNLGRAILSEHTCDKLVAEVSNVIESGMELYGYRIAKAKREELAFDILKALSEEKK